MLPTSVSDWTVFCSFLIFCSRLLILVCAALASCVDVGVRQDGPSFLPPLLFFYLGGTGQTTSDTKPRSHLEPRHVQCL